MLALTATCDHHSTFLMLASSKILCTLYIPGNKYMRNRPYPQYNALSLISGYMKMHYFQTADSLPDCYQINIKEERVANQY
jgi:hypothetical protein